MIGKSLLLTSALAACTWGAWQLPAHAWNTLPSRTDDEPGFQYTPSPADWRKINMYQIMTDRFNDGDPANNHVNGPYQPTERFGIHGGDFAGIRQQLDYIQGMGVKAIWISPVQFSHNAYHAYAVTDFNRIEIRFGSLQELRELIDDCHRRGIYVILDIVINHMADFIGSDDPGFPAFTWSGYNLKWRNQNQKHAPPFDRLDRFHNHGEIDDYDDPWKVLKGEFKPGGLDDIKTTDRDVQDDMIRIFKALIDATDCDGFRVDAVKHVEAEFFARFMPAIYAHAAYRGKTNFLIFGESIDGNDVTLSQWTHGDYQFNSMLHFPMYYKMVDVFVHRQRTSLLTERINDLWRYSANSRHQLVTFLDNHDTWRIMYDQNLNGDVWRLRPALTFLYTSLHIPCLYYGTEQGFNGGTDPWNRENMFDGQFQWGPSAGNAFRTNSEIYQFVRQLNQFRDAYPALTVGQFAQRWQTASGPGIYAYTKTLGAEEVLVVLNTSASTLNCAPAVTRPNGTVYVNLFNPSEKLTVNGGTLSVQVLGHDQKLFATERPPLWIGNLTSWPGPTHPDQSTLEPGEDLWVDVETRPIRNGQTVTLFYRTDPASPWIERTMGWNFNTGNGSFWNVNLGSFPAGVTIEYFARATEGHVEVYANHDGANTSITVTSPGLPSELTYTPQPITGCATVTLTYRPRQGPLAHATHIIAHLGRNNWLDIASPSLTLDPATGTWSHTFPVPPGTHELNLVFHDGAGVWDNNQNQDWLIPVTGCEVDFSGLVITNPVSGTIKTHEQQVAQLQGLFPGGIGHLIISNQLSGFVTTAPATPTWSQEVPLAVGANVIVVRGSNTAETVGAMVYSNRPTDTVYAGGWDGGGWSFYTDSTNNSEAGRFIAQNAPNSNIGTAWGLYANSGKISEAKINDFGRTLAHRDRFRVRFDNGFIDHGFGVGMSLISQNNHNIWEFWFNGGDTNYNMTGIANTGIPWTSGGLDIEFVFLAPNGFEATVTPVGGTPYRFTGTLQGTSPIMRFRAWNYSAGSGPDYDVFLSDMAILNTAAGAITSQTITVTRQSAAEGDSNGDGIPDAWYVRYGFNPYSYPIATLDLDNDGATCWEEYIADTNPTNAASVYPNSINAMTGAGVMALQAGPPTSPERRYDVYWSTNLVGGQWTAMGLNQPGHAHGGPVQLTFTNNLDGRFYRTGVRLP
ncbi:MAG TPA: alpha-amylase family glycosyl hydrolase [Kiritimatiellia bacterium]|nr:alpha-amylase family glycosyl hydrolase [Kiritimatiellia bacterium]HMO98751.1 alpha-amylase family glycosyl hydrolase [Kiritimatiellia bacterium]HMP95927.1 alpha-amylase family glycosyl hydrolase [Kiritimatiellia bacterium]